MKNQTPTKEQEQGCEFNSFRRTRFFPGMLLVDRDFQEEQLYHLKKRWLLNRALHGAGVVCGLEVYSVDGAELTIQIKRGVAFDHQGREIVVCDDFEWQPGAAEDSEDGSRTGTEAKCGMSSALSQGTWCLGIAYCEAPSHPVATYGTGEGCDEEVCDYSRTQEGFRLKLLDECPIPDTGDDRGDLSCPDDRPPDEDFVGLGIMEVDGDGIATVSMEQCRLYAMTVRRSCVSSGEKAASG